MKYGFRVFAGLFMLLFFSPCILHSQSARQSKLDYIASYQELAVASMRQFRIPASIILAQGILESNSGKSELALKANNHFGIKCTSDWEGKVFHQDDDKPNECFRKYQRVEDSFADHARFLQRERYKPLYDIPLTDYQGWARGLKKAGYATNPQYADLLIKLIEDFKLYLLDSEDFALFAEQVLEMKPKPGMDKQGKKVEKAPKRKNWSQEPDQMGLRLTQRQEKSQNGVNYILAEKGDNLKGLTREYDLFPWQIRRFNDLPKNAELSEGQRVYVQAKKRSGDVLFHEVKAGETMHQISQLHAIKLKSLYKWNGMESGLEPNVGQKLRLRKP